MNEYEEERDRNIAAPPEGGYVLTAIEAITKETAKSHEGHCEYVLGEADGKRYSCHNRGRYWVQRGPVNRKSCHQHLARTISDFWQIKPGRYGKSEHYEGYWVSATSTVVVKMQVGDKGLWR